MIYWIAVGTRYIIKAAMCGHTVMSGNFVMIFAQRGQKKYSAPQWPVHSLSGV